MGKRATGNPCTKVCKFDTADVCRGCFRTRAEARGWKDLSDAAKEAVNRRVRPLIAAAGGKGKGKAKDKGGRKRLRKLDRRIARLEEKLAALRAERHAAAADAA